MFSASVSGTSRPWGECGEFTWRTQCQWVALVSEVFPHLPVAGQFGVRALCEPGAESLRPCRPTTPVMTVPARGHTVNRAKACGVRRQSWGSGGGRGPPGVTATGCGIFAMISFGRWPDGRRWGAIRQGPADQLHRSANRGRRRPVCALTLCGLCALCGGSGVGIR